MKILMCLTYYLPNISGLTIYAQRLAEGLAKKGDEVAVLTSQHRKDLPLCEVENAVTIRRVPVTVSLGKGVLMVRFPLVTASLIAKADVVNAHLPQFEVFLIALLAKLMGKRLVLTHHTDLSWWPGIINRISFVAVFISQFLAGLLADRIVPYTQDYARHSYYLRFFRKKTLAIYPPILVTKSTLKVKKRQDGIRIGFAGRIARQKGVPYLLEAIPYLRQFLGHNFEIIFAGPGKEVIGEDYRKEISSIINKYPKQLVFLGSIAPEKMSDFYQSLDVLVLPSDDRLESFGLVQVEAMLCGTPVVATDLPGARMPVKLTRMGEIVSSRDSRALARAIVKVVKNKKQYLKPREEIEKLFSYDNTIAAYQRLFRTGG